MGKMKINQYVVGPVQTNCYFVINEETNEMIVIDPGASGKALADKARKDGYTPVAILLTHGHFDHATAAEELAHEFGGIPIYAYEDEKETYDDFRNDWIGRMVVPYHRTSLWKLCDYIRDYIASVESGSLKREVSFVLSTHNFADNYPIKLSNAVEEDYWTFFSLESDQHIASLDEDAAARLKKRKKQVEKLIQHSKKELFIHDLWTDYAMYLRKWVAKIQNFNAEETIPEDRLDYSSEHDI